MFFVVPEAEQEQDERAKQYNCELVCFSEEVGGVDVGCFGEPGEAAGCKDEFYCDSCGDYEGGYGSENCDAAAKRDDCSMVSAFGGTGDEARFFCQLSDNGG